MPKLEQFISEWRQQMLAAGIKSPIPLDELESHLRDEIEHQITKGLSEEEAFQSAVQNIGQAHAIKTEFKKVQCIMSVRKWIALQILTLGGMSLIALFIAYQLLVRTGNSSYLTSVQLTFCWAALATTLLLLWGGRLGYRHLPVIRSKRMRDAITCSGAVLMMIWWFVMFNAVLPDHDIGQVFMIMCWGFITPMGALIGLTFGLETAARKRPLA